MKEQTRRGENNESVTGMKLPHKLREELSEVDVEGINNIYLFIYVNVIIVNRTRLLFSTVVYV